MTDSDCGDNEGGSKGWDDKLVSCKESYFNMILICLCIIENVNAYLGILSRVCVYVRAI